MSEQQNVRLVQEFNAAFKRGDVTGALSTLADDVGWFIPGPKDIIPFVGQRQGREQVAQFFAKLAEMQDAEQFELREFVAQGDKAVALGHYRWRIKSTGRSYASDFAHVFTIYDGKVSNFQEYLNTQAWAAAYRGAQSSAAGKLTNDCMVQNRLLVHRLAVGEREHEWPGGCQRSASVVLEVRKKVIEA